MPIQFERLSVLVVEDIAPMRDLMTAVLKAIGVGQIHTAPNGQVGLDKFRQHKPDIVITDWEMDPVSGLELTEKIRQDENAHDRAVPILVVTGYSALERVKKARDFGVTEFLAKPFTAVDITQRIASIINKPRDFVDVDNGYFGPERRRTRDPHYNGPYRRDADAPGS